MSEIIKSENYENIFMKYVKLLWWCVGKFAQHHASQHAKNMSCRLLAIKIHYGKSHSENHFN